MIATTRHYWANDFDYTNTTATDDSYIISNGTNYYYRSITIINTQPILSLKEQMKLWAKERMRLFWYNPDKVNYQEIIPPLPINLRGTIISGHGWARSN